MTDYQLLPNSETGSRNYAVELWSSLDPRYYPRYIRDTNIGVFFEGIGEQLWELDANVTQLYNDQFVTACRTSPYPGRRQTKLYENFGLFVCDDINLYQDPEVLVEEGTGSGWQGYRRQVETLIVSGMSGGTRAALIAVGEAFTGMSPIIQEHIDARRCRLSSWTGSVAVIGATSLRIGSPDWFPVHKWAGANVKPANETHNYPGLRVTDSDYNTLYFDEAEDIRTVLSVGRDFSVSFSALDRETHIYGESQLYYGVSVHFWLPSWVTNSIQITWVSTGDAFVPTIPTGSTESWPSQPIEFERLGVISKRYTVKEFKERIVQAVRDFTPAHVRPQIYFHDRYTLLGTQAALSEGTWDNTKLVVDNSSIYNLVGVDGEVWESDTINIGRPYGYKWFPSWMSKSENDAHLSVQIRFSNNESMSGSSDWYGVEKDLPIVRNLVDQYLQFRVLFYGSGSLDCSLYSLSMKGMFYDPDALLGTFLEARYTGS